MSRAMVASVRLSVEKVPDLIHKYLVLGRSISCEMRPVRVKIEPGHIEAIKFYVLEHPVSILILGLPWLRRCSPTLDWNTTSV